MGPCAHKRIDLSISLSSRLYARTIRLFFSYIILYEGCDVMSRRDGALRALLFSRVPRAVRKVEIPLPNPPSSGVRIIAVNGEHLVHPPCHKVYIDLIPPAVTELFAQITATIKAAKSRLYSNFACWRSTSLKSGRTHGAMGAKVIQRKNEMSTTPYTRWKKVIKE